MIHGVRRDVQAKMAEASGAAKEVGTITDVYICVLPFMVGDGCGDCLVGYLPRHSVVDPNLVKGAR